jgi:phosphonate transport system substrate-binding protein
MLRWRLALLALSAMLACDARKYREVEVSLAPAPRPPVVASPALPARPLRISVAPVESPRETYGTYTRLLSRVGEQLGLGVEFVQRRTYREVNDLLAAGQLDAAILCTGGYLDLQARLPGTVEVLVAPVVGGESTYRSVLIVPAASAAKGLRDLAGKRFAFTDELSLTGRTWVMQRLKQLGRDPDRFFGGTAYTRSHDRSIAGVAAGIVDGAAVHSLVLEHLLSRDANLSGRVRVIERSPPFGMMPIVASTRLDPSVRARLRDVLTSLDRDAVAGVAMRELGVDRFITPPRGLYESAQRVQEAVR